MFHRLVSHKYWLPLHCLFSHCLQCAESCPLCNAEIQHTCWVVLYWPVYHLLYSSITAKTSVISIIVYSQIKSSTVYHPCHYIIFFLHRSSPPSFIPFLIPSYTSFLPSFLPLPLREWRSTTWRLNCGCQMNAETR